METGSNNSNNTGTGHASSNGGGVKFYSDAEWETIIQQYDADLQAARQQNKKFITGSWCKSKDIPHAQFTIRYWKAKGGRGNASSTIDTTITTNNNTTATTVETNDKCSTLDQVRNTLEENEWNRHVKEYLAEVEAARENYRTVSMKAWCKEKGITYSKFWRKIRKIKPKTRKIKRKRSDYEVESGSFWAKLLEEYQDEVSNKEKENNTGTKADKLSLPAIRGGGSRAAASTTSTSSASHSDKNENTTLSSTTSAKASHNKLNNTVAAIIAPVARASVPAKTAPGFTDAAAPPLADAPPIVAADLPVVAAVPPVAARPATATNGTGQGEDSETNSNKVNRGSNNANENVLVEYEAEWDRHFKEYAHVVATRGVDMKAWCKEKGIEYSSFGRRFRSFRRRKETGNNSEADKLPLPAMREASQSKASSTVSGNAAPAAISPLLAKTAPDFTATLAHTPAPFNDPLMADPPSSRLSATTKAPTPLVAAAASAAPPVASVIAASLPVAGAPAPVTDNPVGTTFAAKNAPVARDPLLVKTTPIYTATVAKAPIPVCDAPVADPLSSRISAATPVPNAVAASPIEARAPAPFAQDPVETTGIPVVTNNDECSTSDSTNALNAEWDKILDEYAAYFKARRQNNEVICRHKWCEEKRVPFLEFDRRRLSRIIQQYQADVEAYGHVDVKSWCDKMCIDPSRLHDILNIRYRKQKLAAVNDIDKENNGNAEKLSPGIPVATQNGQNIKEKKPVYRTDEEWSSIFRQYHVDVEAEKEKNGTLNLTTWCKKMGIVDRTFAARRKRNKLDIDPPNTQAASVAALGPSPPIASASLTEETRSPVPIVVAAAPLVARALAPAAGNTVVTTTGPLAVTAQLARLDAPEPLDATAAGSRAQAPAARDPVAPAAPPLAPLLVGTVATGSGRVPPAAAVAAPPPPAATPTVAAAATQLSATTLPETPPRNATGPVPTTTRVVISAASPVAKAPVPATNYQFGATVETATASAAPAPPVARTSSPDAGIGDDAAATPRKSAAPAGTGQVEASEAKPAAICNGAGQVDDIIIAPQLDGMDKLVFVDLHQNNAQAVAATVTQLADLMDSTKQQQNWKERRREAADVSAYYFIILAMRKWPQEETVQASGCQCLNMMIRCSGVFVKERIVRAGGMEAMLSAMKIYPKSTLIHECCIFALQLLLKPTEPTEPVIATASTRFFNQLGGMEQVFESMKEFSTRRPLILVACLLLDNYLKNNSNETTRRRVIQAGGLAVIGQVMAQHSQTTAIQFQATSFMKKLFSG